MEDFVTYKLAKKLREKGFREKCLCYYNDDNIEYNYDSLIFNHEMYISHNSYDNIWHRDYIDAPTISQALDWLRKKKLHIRVSVYFIGWCVDVTNMDGKRMYSTECTYDTYEDAALTGIEYVLDNLL